MTSKSYTEDVFDGVGNDVVLMRLLAHQRLFFFQWHFLLSRVLVTVREFSNRRQLHARTST